MVMTAADTAVLLRAAVALETLVAAGITVDGLEVDIATVDIDALIAGIANGKTLADLDVHQAAILAKLSADQATQTTLAAVLAKIIAAPATEAKQDTQEISLDAIVTKLSADPATQTTLAAIQADTNELTAAPVAKAPTSVVQVLAGTPAPIALPAGDATAIYLQAARANGANTGDVFIGLIADLVSGTKNYVKLTPGDTWEYICRPGTKVAMAIFGIDGETATDGVIGYSEPV